MSNFEQDTQILIPARPPTHATISNGYLFSQLVKSVGIVMLLLHPGHLVSIAAGVVAVFAVAIDFTIKLRSQLADRVTDLGRWRILRKLRDLDFEAIRYHAAGLDVEQTAIFMAGVDAYRQQVDLLILVEAEQANRELRSGY